MLYIVRKPPYDHAEIEASKKRADELLEKYICYVDEIKEFHEENYHILSTIATSGYCEFHVLVTVYINGLIVGLEMNRSDEIIATKEET